MMMARSPLWLMPFGMSKRKTHGVLLKWRPMAYCQNMLAGTCFKLAVFEAAGRPHFAQEIYRGISWVSQSKYTILSKMQTQQQALNTSAGSTDPQPMDIGLMHKEQDAQGRRKELQRTKRRKDTMAQQRKRIQRIQQQWIWQRQSINTNWLRQCVHRIRIGTMGPLLSSCWCFLFFLVPVNVLCSQSHQTCTGT